MENVVVLKRASKKTGARRGAPGDEKFTDTSTASEWRPLPVRSIQLVTAFSMYYHFLTLLPSFSLLWFSLLLSQACRDRGWTSAAAGVAPLPTCGVKSACYASPSDAWWRQTLSTWWCSVLWLSTPSVWPSSTTTSPTGSPSSSVGFSFECCVFFWGFFLHYSVIYHLRNNSGHVWWMHCFWQTAASLSFDIIAFLFSHLQTMQSLFSWGFFWLRCSWKCMVLVSGSTFIHLSTASTVGWGPISLILTPYYTRKETKNNQSNSVLCHKGKVELLVQN